MLKMFDEIIIFIAFTVFEATQLAALIARGASDSRPF